MHELRASLAFALVASTLCRTVEDLPRFSLEAYEDAIGPDSLPAYYFLKKNEEASTSAPIWYIDTIACSAGCADDTACPLQAEQRMAPWRGAELETGVGKQGTNGGFGQWLWDEKKAHVGQIPCMNIDTYLGDRDLYGLPFRGAATFRAVFADLVKTQGLGSSGERELLLVEGGSAATTSVMQHLDRIRSYLGEEAAANVLVVGLLDSGTVLPCAHIGDDEREACRALVEESDEAHQFRKRLNQWNSIFLQLYNESWTGDPASDECALANQDDPGLCMYLEYKLRYLRTPVFNVVNTFELHLYDQSMPGLQVSANECVDEEARCAGALEMGHYQREEFLSGAFNKTGSANFLTGCYVHSPTRFDSTYMTVKAGGVTLLEAFEEYIWRGHDSWTDGIGAKDAASAEPLNYADPEICEGFSCGECAADCGGKASPSDCTCEACEPADPAAVPSPAPEAEAEAPARKFERRMADKVVSKHSLLP